MISTHISKFTGKIMKTGLFWIRVLSYHSCPFTEMNHENMKHAQFLEDLTCERKEIRQEIITAVILLLYYEIKIQYTNYIISIFNISLRFIQIILYFFYYTNVYEKYTIIL